MPIRLRRTERFVKEFGRLKPDLLAAATEALKDLLLDPIPKTRRFHPLTGYKNPRIFKIDVTSNHSHQISFEIEGDTRILRRVATHKEIDRDP